MTIARVRRILLLIEQLMEYESEISEELMKQLAAQQQGLLELRQKQIELLLHERE